MLIVLCFLKLPTSVLHVNLASVVLWMDTEEGHHSAIKQVCYFALHLHVYIFDKHAVHDCDGLKVH